MSQNWSVEARRKCSERMKLRHAQGFKFAHNTKWSDERKRKHSERLKELHVIGNYEGSVAKWSDEKKRDWSKRIKTAWRNGSYDFERSLRANKFCVEGSKKWGTYPRTGNYILIWHDRNWHLEHRYLMERHIGRKLVKGEHVHHINFIPYDNRIENLQTVNASEHARLHRRDSKLSEETKAKIKNWYNTNVVHSKDGRFKLLNH